MINIRNNVFETNSSSTHSVVILRKEDWEEVKKGNLFIDIMGADEKEKLLPRLVTQNLLIAEAREAYLEEERHFGKDSHRSFKDGHYISWEEIMSRYNGDYQGYNINIFGWAGEKYINPTSQVWEKHDEKDLGDGRVKVEIEHFFG